MSCSPPGAVFPGCCEPLTIRIRRLTVDFLLAIGIRLLRCASRQRFAAAGVLPVFQTVSARLRRAVDAAENSAVLFDPMPDNVTTTMLAGRSQGVDCTLERVEGVLLASHPHSEGLVVVVTANFAFHGPILPPGIGAKAVPQGIFSTVHGCPDSRWRQADPRGSFQVTQKQPQPTSPCMDLAWISLAALLVVMAVSCTSTVNAGVLSIA